MDEGPSGKHIEGQEEETLWQSISSSRECCVCELGLTGSKTNGSMEVTSQGVV